MYPYARPTDNSQAYQDTPGYAAQVAIEKLRAIEGAIKRGKVLSNRFEKCVRRARELVMEAEQCGLDGLDTKDLHWAEIHVKWALRSRGFVERGL